MNDLLLTLFLYKNNFGTKQNYINLNIFQKINYTQLFKDDFIMIIR
jgi:hypothetical protein